jgi:hypothetical protein
VYPAVADSQLTVGLCALAVVDCGQAGLERGVDDPPERQPSRVRSGAGVHAGLTVRLAAAAAGSGARIWGLAMVVAP